MFGLLPQCYNVSPTILNGLWHGGFNTFSPGQGFKTCVVLFILLGMTQVFSLLIVKDPAFVSQYIFTILNPSLPITLLYSLSSSNIALIDRIEFCGTIHKSGR